MNDRSRNSLAASRSLLLGTRGRLKPSTVRGPLQAAGSVIALLSLSACLLDLEGGPARVQVRSTGSDTLVALTIGAWRHDFVPSIVPGKTSETVELPVSGRLRIGLWASRDGRDTLLSNRLVDVGVAEFVRLE